jgi:hypothetical protein
MLIFQSHVVVKISAKTDESAGHATGFVMPMARDSGNQKTLNPYAIPMQRWIASAAGGTSHRLNSGDAMVRSFASHPGSALLPNAPAVASLMQLSSYMLLCTYLFDLFSNPIKHFAGFEATGYHLHMTIAGTLRNPCSS